MSSFVIGLFTALSLFSAQFAGAYESQKAQLFNALDLFPVASVGDICTNELQNIFEDAYQGSRDVVYIVTGDSTRHPNHMEMYYEMQLSQLNIDLHYNAQSGQSADNWRNNIAGANATLEDAIAHSRGVDGADTIIEFSLGLNDYDNVKPIAEVKATLKDAVMQYQAAKPAAKIILVTPVYTANTTRNVELTQAYHEIGNELDLPVVDIVDDMGTVHPYVIGDDRWYGDTTHPSEFGSRRVIDLVLDSVVPDSLINKLFIYEYGISSLVPTKKIEDISENIAFPTSEGEATIEQLPVDGIEVGYWSSSDGSAAGHDDWRRLSEVAVQPGWKLRITHGGNRRDVKFINDEGTLIQSINMENVGGEYLTITVPEGATFARFNLSSDGSSYDALNDTPTVGVESSDPLSLVKEGFWSSSSGQAIPNSDWRRLSEVAVQPGWKLRIAHRGNRHDVKFVDENENIIANINTDVVDGELYRTVTVPAGATYARINVSSNGASYDALNDVPYVVYEKAGAIEEGYWSSSDGSAAGHDDWRRLSEVAVQPGWKLRITHGGNRRDVKFVDENENLVLNQNAEYLPDGKTLSIVVPQGATKARINVSSNGASYDALNDVPRVSLAVNQGEYIQTGFWSSSNGKANPKSTWRRMVEVPVEAGWELFVKHQGNRYDVKFVDENDVLVDNVNTGAVPSTNLRTITVPEGATFARFNLSSDGASYDALNDVPEVYYRDLSILSDTMSISDIHLGLDLRTTGGSRASLYDTYTCTP